MARKQMIEGGTKNRIREVGGRQIFEHGYDGTSVRGIMLEVGGEVALMVNPAFPSDCYSPQSSKKRIRFTYAAAAVFGMLPLVMIVIMYIESKAFA